MLKTLKPPFLLASCCVLVILSAISVNAQDADPALKSGPRPGKYRITSYGRVGAPPLFLGHFVLSEGGQYTAYLAGEKLQGEGTYAYDPAKQTVLWKSGPYKDVWSGQFTVEREGKTHKIRLKSTTIATNSME